MEYAVVSSVSAVHAKPFTKWPGGKRSLLPFILPLVPEKIGTYFEPFVGGGAVFFALKNEGRIRTAFINDTNRRLIVTYRGIKSDPEMVIAKLKRMKNDEEYFLRVRARKLSEKPVDTHATAAWMIYLNKTCFNGLYRVNKKNEFNVPFGYYVNPKICDAENIRACALALRGTTFGTQDFEAVTTTATKGDFVYYDPPYLQRVGNEFVAYGTDHFGLEDHVRLRDRALMLKEQGVHVMISNSGADPIRKLYASRAFKVHEVNGARTIGAHGSTRGTMPDLLIQ